MPSAESQWWMTCNGWKNMNFGKSSSDKQIYLQTMTFIVSTKEFSVSDLVLLLSMFSDKNTDISASLLLSQPIKSYCETHLPWQPVNLKMSLQRQFHFPPALFTCLMKNLGVPEIIACELLHSGQNFRGICKSIKNAIFGLENNLYLHYSHKGVIVRVEETISKLQNWQIWGEHSPIIYPNVQFFTHNIIMGPPSKWS